MKPIRETCPRCHHSRFPIRTSHEIARAVLADPTFRCQKPCGYKSPYESSSVEALRAAVEADDDLAIVTAVAELKGELPP